MPDIWFTADTHYGHRNIVKGCSEWDDLSQCRNFATLKEHDQRLVHNINSVVKEDDILYHIGDWSFGGDESIWRFRRQLRCGIIHLIGGNHDHHIRKNKILTTNSGLFHAQSFFTTYQELLEKQLRGKQMVVMCHYAFQTWHGAKKGAWHLHGHSHGRLGDSPYRRLDVGIDCHPHFRPFNYEEIKSIMDKKELLDHHESRD